MMFNRNYVLCVWGGFIATALCLLALAMIAAGCGGYDEDEVGTTEQDLTIKIQPHFIHGLNRSSQNALCKGVPGGGTEECYVPYKGTQTFCFQNGAEDEKTAMRAALGKVALASNNKFAWTEFSAATCNAALVDWKVNFSFPCGVVGSASNNTFDYVCANETVAPAGSFIGTANGGLTKFYAFRSPTATQVAGVAHVDTTDIDARAAGLTAAQKIQFKDHVYANLAMQMVGRGRRNDAASNAAATGGFLTPYSTRATGTAGDLCALQSYSFANPGTFGTSGSCPTD